MIAKFDDRLLAAGDALILWVWNRFEIQRIAVLRAVMLGYVATFGVKAVLEDSATGWLTSAIVALIWLSLFVWKEIQAARTSPRALNAMTLVVRTWPTSRGGRALTLLLGLLPRETLNSWLSGLLVQVAGLTLLVLLDSLAPEDPPKRPEPKVASLPLRTALAGGD